MALNDDLIKALENGQTPLIILQLSLNQLHEYFVADSGGIWRFNIRGIYEDVADELLIDVPTLDTIGIGNVVADGVTLPEVTTYTDTITGRAAALASEPSFIYDGDSKTLYLRLNNYDKWYTSEINLGLILALSNRAYYDYVNNIPYVPDLNNAPSFSTRKDEIFFGKIQFPSFNQDVNNVDYRYDDKTESNIFGALAEYYLGAYDPEDRRNSLAFEFFEPIYTARVSRYDFSPGVWSFLCKDGRRSFSNPLPVNQVNTTTYPNADDYDVSEYLPLVYGNYTDVTCLSLDEQASPANFRFAFADTNDFQVDVSSYEIKVEGAVVTPSVVPNGSTGIFSLSSADYSKGNKVTYSGKGFKDGSGDLIENQVSIVQHILENYADTPYNSNRFNLTEWEAERLKAPNIGLVVYKKTNVIDVIEALLVTNKAGFLIQPDGLITWRTFDETQDPVIQIKNNDWLDDGRPVLTGDVDEVRSSATVLYDQSIGSQRWKRETDTTREQQVKQDFEIVEDEEFKTNYTNSSDASAFAVDIMDDSANVRQIITGSTLLKFYTGDIGQVAEIEVNHPDGSEWLGVLKCEILEIDPDSDDNECSFKFRVIEKLDEFSFNRFITTDDGRFITTDDGRYITED